MWEGSWGLRGRVEDCCGVKREAKGASWVKEGQQGSRIYSKPNDDDDRELLRSNAVGHEREGEQG